MGVTYEVTDIAQPRQLAFKIEPPKLVGPIEVRAPKPLELSVAAPRPVRLALACGDQLAPSYELDVDDLRHLPTLPLRLVPLNVERSRGKGLSAEVGVRGELTADGTTLVAFQRGNLRLLSVGDRPPASFYRDSVCRCELVVTPQDPSAALAGGTQQLVLRQPAPLKRLLMWTAAVLLVVAVIAVPARFAWTVYGPATPRLQD